MTLTTDDPRVSCFRWLTNDERATLAAALRDQSPAVAQHNSLLRVPGADATCCPWGLAAQLLAGWPRHRLMPPAWWVAEHSPRPEPFLSRFHLAVQQFMYAWDHGAFHAPALADVLEAMNAEVAAMAAGKERPA